MTSTNNVTLIKLAEISKLVADGKAKCEAIKQASSTIVSTMQEIRKNLTIRTKPARPVLTLVKG